MYMTKSGMPRTSFVTPKRCKRYNKVLHKKVYESIKDK